mmetsp:Transcript_9146/g.28601  ORF Transcript_9146/g.28601 Transcript_9146/m.28601 type:complete len:147 (-) Transcript_9146:24-464(-)
MSIRSPVRDDFARYDPLPNTGTRQYGGPAPARDPWAPKNYKGITSSTNPLCRHFSTSTNTTSRRASATDRSLKGCGKSLRHGFDVGAVQSWSKTNSSRSFGASPGALARSLPAQTSLAKTMTLPVGRLGGALAPKGWVAGSWSGPK